MANVVPASPGKMKPVTEVADKAVSTEDLVRVFLEQDGGHDFLTQDGGDVEFKHPSTALELIRLEAFLAALVESKVVAIKASGKHRKSLARPNRLVGEKRHENVGHNDCGNGQYLTSNSIGSSNKENHHHHHKHRHHHKTRQADILSSGLFPKKRHRHHHHRHHHHHDHARDDPRVDDNDDDDGRIILDRGELLEVETAFCGSTTTLAPPAAPGTSSTNGCLVPPSPYHSGYHNHLHHLIPHGCPSPTHSQSKILMSHYDTEYIVLNMEEEEILRRQEEEEEDDVVTPKRRKRRRRKRKYRVGSGREEGEHRPKRIDPEDLPKRARWTIIATACLLLLMSVLLVGVTLRMAPIIDEMVRKQNEQHQNSLSREGETGGGLFNLSGITPSSLEANPPP